MVKYLIRKIIAYCNLMLCHFFYYPYALLFYLSGNKVDKLHVGCGNNKFKGWLNADINLKSDVIIFLQKRLPFRDNSLKRIYSEHVLEHVSYKIAVFFLREAYRTLRPRGIIRVAMPDLDDLVAGYYENNWRRFDWINWPDFSFIKTRAEMINIAFRWWGHQHLYNKEELSRALREAGFTQFTFVENNQSENDDLLGLETRLDSKLIVEAVKT